MDYAAAQGVSSQQLELEDNLTIRGGKTEQFLSRCSVVERVDIHKMEVPAKDAKDLGFCFGYIWAVVDSVTLVSADGKGKPSLCVPEDVTSTQAAKIVIKYGNDHPEELNQLAMVVIPEAVRKSFPCKQAEFSGAMTWATRRQSNKR